MFAGVRYVGDAGTRVPVQKAARRSTSPPRASVHVDALVISILSADSNFNFGETVSERDVVRGRCKKRSSGSTAARGCVRRATAGRRQERRVVDADECSCGPAHLRRARSSIRMRDVPAGSKNSCAEQGRRDDSHLANLVQKSISSTEIQRIAMRCYAMRCAEFRWMPC